MRSGPRSRHPMRAAALPALPALFSLFAAAALPATAASLPEGAAAIARAVCEGRTSAEAQVRDAQMALVHKIKTVVGVTVRVEIGAPGSVARSQGKAVRIVDTRPKD